MPKLSIEIDTPPAVYLASREFTGQLVDRQLHRPLFKEDGLAISPDLLSTHDKVGNREWVFRLADDAAWGTGDAITAGEVAQRLLQVTNQQRGAWVSALIERCDVPDDRTLRLTTRLPTAILDRILTNPLLAPRRMGRSSGSYRLSRIEENRVIIVQRDNALHSIELLTTHSRDEGRRRFRSGLLDIGWGIGVPPEFWADDDSGPFPRTGELDMFVVATAGSDVPQAAADNILDSLVLSHGAPAGVEPRVSRFFSKPGEKVEASDPRGGRWPLYYTDFPPNRELADHIAEAAKGCLVPTPIDYMTMVAAAVPKAGFSIQIHATQFPDTLGVQIESLLVARGVLPASRALRVTTMSGWEAETEEGRLEGARAAERPLDQLLRRRVIGRMRPRFRSGTPLELPRSGWLDFHRLQGEPCK